MKCIDSFYQIVLIEDRYSGVYSRGKWLAIMSAQLVCDAKNSSGQEFKNITRLSLVFNEDLPGPSSGDVTAMRFWDDPPDWIAVGDTPDQALSNALNK